MIEVRNPANQFFDKDGSPLDDGYIYIGTQFFNPETSPQAVFWDKAGTIPAAQPIRTINGYPARTGSPSKFYTSGLYYSITVKDKKGALVISTIDSDNGFLDQLTGVGTAGFVGYDNAASGLPSGNVQGAIDALADKFEGYLPWFPAIGAPSGSITTMGPASGRYTRVGSTITFDVSISIITNGTASGGITFTLPVPCAQTAVTAGRDTAASGAQLQVFIPVGAVATIYRYDNNHPAINGSVLRVSGSYEI